MNPDELVLGVDGGGTKTVAWLALRQPSDERDVVGRGRAGPSNPSSVGFTAAMAALGEAIGSAFQDANIRPQPLAAACLALAGADRSAEAARFREWSEDQELASALRLSNDAEPILACTKDGWGVALIAGTGSFALGRSPDGQTAKVGGWGFRCGDEGSGYAIATEALAAAAKFADGRGPQTSLLDHFMAHFTVSEPRELISRLYDSQVDRRVIADLAPLVLAQSRDGDETARSIVVRAAESLCLMVLAAAKRLSLPSGFPLALTGGLLINSAVMRGKLGDQLRGRGITPEFALVPEPVLGAVQLARRLADGDEK